MRALETRLRLMLVLVAVHSVGGLAATSGAPLAQVVSGAFDILVVEEAELNARRSVTIASDLPSNTAKIAWLVPDGAFVAAGDTVVRFDAEPFREALTKAEREHADARAALLQAEAEMQILVRRNAEQDDTLAHQIEIAQLRLAQFRNAERVLRLGAARNEVLGARTAFEQARQEAETQRQLRDQGFSSSLLHAQAQALELEKKNAAELAENNVALLEEVVLPTDERERELDLERKKRERNAMQQANLHGVAKQRAVIMGLTNRVAAYAAAVEQARVLLDNTEIDAPVAGFAIHVPTSVGNAFRKVQVGDSVWRRHGFITIPDMSALVADVRVREIDIGKIKTDQPVALHPEAYAEVRLDGRVEVVGTLAEPRRTQAQGSTDNEFAVRISVAGVDERLRPGMRARAEILARRFEEVLRIPVEAVFRDSGESVCFVWGGARGLRRPVKLGESDGSYVIVKQGLEEGERVMLVHPDNVVAHAR